MVYMKLGTIDRYFLKVCYSYNYTELENRYVSTFLVIFTRN